MVLAASVPGDFAGALADFGAGAGAAGLAVLSRVRGATATLVEQSPEMAQFAMRTLGHPANAALASRASILVAAATIFSASPLAMVSRMASMARVHRVRSTWSARTTCALGAGRGGDSSAP